jgi:ABC-type nickel/cobalt efflux system permease component RcnA
MAIGTAITVSTLAALAVASRGIAERLAGSGSHWGSRIESMVGVLVSVLILLMGATFFIASLHGAAPL